ncbi:MAG: Asp-tRNA(Asn)/Glu-tRNA(Gln) amidotransferase subunit GatB [Alphaproteobacteria bacterium]
MGRASSDEWEVVIGLEIHAQVTSKAKLFSGAATDFGGQPNAQASFVDAGFPGMLPVINRLCVEQAVRTGLGLKARINLVSVFDRKNYFYPDLPAGYQISQYLQPIVGEGVIELDIEDADGKPRRIGITRLHLEQDAGKSLHDQDPKRTFVDLNRSGVALMEIVSEPDMRTAEEAGEYVRKIRSILRYLGTCDGNMEEGSMRADVNVSVRRRGEDYGTRTETKNVNSIRFIEATIRHEAARQIDVLEAGGAIVQETRLFDSDKGVTRPMRSKEEAHDYRYFPDPDLLPLVLDADWVDTIKAGLPELPDEKKMRFVGELGLSAYDAGVLVAERETADYFEAAIGGKGGASRDPKLAANWIISELFARLKKAGKEIGQSPVGAGALGGLIDLIANDTISGRIAKDVFDEMFDSGKEASQIVEQKGLKQITDSGEIETILDKIIADNPGQAAQYKDNPKVVGWFVGQVMKATGGKANPKLVNALIARKLGG